MHHQIDYMEKNTAKQGKDRLQNVYPIPKPILWGAKILQSISYEWAAAYSRFFFKKPVEPPVKKFEKELRNKAKITKLKIPVFNKKIVAYQWGNGPKKALILHGWSGRATQLNHLIDSFLKNNYTVYAFDAPAHGLSGGQTTNMVEYIESIVAMDQAFGPFDIIVGHSMGGISAANAVARKNVRTKKLVTIGIPDSIEKIFYQFAEVMGLKPAIAELNIRYMKDKLHTDIKHLAGSYNAQKIRIPVLQIHDKQDKEVPFAEAENLSKHWQNGEFYVTDGLGHRRILRNPEVLQKIMDFAEKNE